MADFKKGIVIRGGELAGSIIGIDTFDMSTDGSLGNNGVPYSYIASFNNLNRNAGQTVADDVEGYQFFNQNFENMIEISSYFSKDGPVYSETNLADIAILDQQTGNITGYFSLYIDRPNLNDPSYVHVYGRVKNSSGVVIGGFNSAGSIAIQMGSGFAEPKVYLVFSKAKYGDDTIFGLYVNAAQWNRWSGRVYHEMAYAGAWIDEDTIESTWGISGKIDDQTKDKSPTFGPAGETGGYGPGEPGSGSTGGIGGPAPTFDGTSDPWDDTPAKPGVLSFGLLNVYKCDTGALINLGDTLFPTMPTFPKPVAPGAGSTWEFVKWCGDILTWLADVITAFSDSIWNKGLIDYIVSVHLVPVDVAAGSLEDIKVGPRTMTGTLARPVSADVVEIDCGTLKVDEYYTSFIDYMTRASIYIPFYGMVPLKPEYWQSAELNLKYLWNIMDGTFIAKLYSTINRHQSPCKVLIGQYSGSACVHMPLSGANYASMFAQLAGSAAGMAAGAASGNVTVAATSAMALTGATNADMVSSNPYNASGAFYGHARPFIKIERPISHFSERYTEEKGVPLLVSKRLGDCSGFTIAEDAILDGIPCTVEEKNRIRNYLKNGVIIK